MGPPPLYKATSSRMSPAGIPMFYGALDEATVLAETPKKKPYITVAKYHTLVNLNILDLTELPPVPCIFDSHTRHQRTEVQFLHSFVENISKPISKNGAEHIDYVPTQIVTEYFKCLFKTRTRRRINGIFYPSSLRKGGKCCVLFLDINKCTQDRKELKNKIIMLDTNTIKPLKVSGH